MNKKVKNLLIITVVLQMLLLVLPTGIVAANQYKIEKDAPIKGKEFTFVLLNMAFYEEDKLYVSFSLEKPMEYYSSNQKIQVSTDENGQTIGYNYKGENNWYMYGRYYSENLPLEKLHFREEYDLEKFKNLLSEKEIKEQWYFDEDAWNEGHFEAQLSAVVYKGLIIPKSIYVDGVKIIEIE